MATQLSAWLYRRSTGWVALAAIALFVLFLVLVLPSQAARARQNTGVDESPDSSLMYSRDDLYRIAELYGAEGRAAYIRARFTFDVIWPLVYTGFLSTALSWVYGRAFAPGSPWRYANLSPVLGALFDYGENLATSLVMARYPARTPVVDLLAPVLTLVKWLFVNGSFLLLAVGVLVALWRWLMRRPQRT
ncbi:MAG TPA: hypothetical protein VGD69_32530 [Herpetosiphonaceae bacterium]